MDVVLEGFDTYLFDRIYAQWFPASNATITTNSGDWKAQAANHSDYQFYPASNYLSFPPSSWIHRSSWPRDNIWRQTLSLHLITCLFGIAVYFVCASLSYYFVFDKNTSNHPKYLKNQVRLEIQQTLRSIPVMAIFTTPVFVAEVCGYSKLYDTTQDGPGMWYNLLQFPLFFVFTDFSIYWIHRGLHHPLIYRHLHKAHHKWIMPTPYASYAFHPVDGFAQSIPYHLFPFILPLQKFAYIVLFAFITIWTVIIHDGEYIADSPIINGAACHTMHHLYFNYNYGQFTTLFDRLFGSYRRPNDELFKKELKMCKAEWEKQSKEMERIAREVEGSDDRQYLPEKQLKKDQ